MDLGGFAWGPGSRCTSPVCCGSAVGCGMHLHHPGQRGEHLARGLGGPTATPLLLGAAGSGHPLAVAVLHMSNPDQGLENYYYNGKIILGLL